MEEIKTNDFEMVLFLVIWKLCYLRPQAPESDSFLGRCSAEMNHWIIDLEETINNFDNWLIVLLF